MRYRVLLPLLALSLTACDGVIHDPPGAPRHGAPVAGGMDDPQAWLGPRLVRLTPGQLDAVVASMVPDATIGERLAETDGPRHAFFESGRFENAAGSTHLTEPHVRNVYEAAHDVARRVSADRSRHAPCLAEGLEDRACIGDFIDTFGAGAFRRPVEAEERERLLFSWSAAIAETDPTTALELVVRGILMSPSFLFRSELGVGDASDGHVQLTSWEVASALSFLITDGPPDDTLREAAARGELTDRDAVEAQARRLLSSAESLDGLVHFLRELFAAERIVGATKDGELFPFFDEGLKASMERETSTFLRHVMSEGDGSLTTLLTADYTFVDDRLAELYGVDAPAEPFGRVSLPRGERAGVLTQASFLAAMAHPDETSIVQRGRFVRIVLLCGAVPPPPPNVDAAVGARDRESVTLREHIAASHSVRECATCHSLMDPIGYPFEVYDAVGRFRTEDHGLPLDGTGRVEGWTSPEVSSATHLAARLSTSEDVRTCVTSHFVQYAMGVPFDVTDPFVAWASDRLAEAAGDLRELVVAVVTSDTFLTRRAP